MKIARFIYEWPPPWTGLYPVGLEWSRAQVKVGHQVTVFSARWPKAGEMVTIKGVENLTVWRSPINGLLFFTSSILIFIRYLVWRKSNKPDLVHSHGHFAFWYYVYRAFLERFMPWHEELDIPLVVHFHNTVKGRWENLLSTGQRLTFISTRIEWPLGILSDKLALKVSGSQIYVSEALKNEAIKYYNAVPEKGFVIESGVNIEIFTPVSPEEKSKSRSELKLEENDIYILYLGFVVERKNPHILIESLKFLPSNYKLLVVGSMPDREYRNKIDKIIEDNHFQGRVVMVGYTPYPQTPIAYQVSDLFVIPSSFEGMPKVVMEALACGIPVLGRAFKLNEEINGLNYFESLKPEDLAVEIRAVLSKHQTVDTQKVRLKYSWDERAKEARNAYEMAKRDL